jgi:OOP family OmpA-OmpF porin
MTATKKSILCAALLSACATAFAGTNGINKNNSVGYVIDQRDFVVKNGISDTIPTNLCWRTGYWTPAMAIAECDPDLVKTAAAPVKREIAPVAPVVSKPTAEKVSLSADALFDFNKATLRREGMVKLDEVAAKSAQIQLQAVTAVGHADRFGSDGYNQRLSERRAAAVKQYLVSKGVAADRVATEGKGETQPRTKADQCVGARPTKEVVACLQPDRRVEIELIGNQ